MLWVSAPKNEEVELDLPAETLQRTRRVQLDAEGWVHTLTHDLGGQGTQEDVFRLMDHEQVRACWCVTERWDTPEVGDLYAVDIIAHMKDITENILQALAFPDLTLAYKEYRRILGLLVREGHGQGSDAELAPDAPPELTALYESVQDPFSHAYEALEAYFVSETGRSQLLALLEEKVSIAPGVSSTTEYLYAVPHQGSSYGGNDLVWMTAKAFPGQMTKEFFLMVLPECFGQALVGLELFPQVPLSRHEGPVPSPEIIEIVASLWKPYSPTMGDLTAVVALAEAL